MLNKQHFCKNTQIYIKIKTKYEYFKFSMIFKVILILIQENKVFWNNSYYSMLWDNKFYRIEI